MEKWFSETDKGKWMVHGSLVDRNEQENPFLLSFMVESKCLRGHSHGSNSFLEVQCVSPSIARDTSKMVTSLFTQFNKESILLSYVSYHANWTRSEIHFQQGLP